MQDVPVMKWISKVHKNPIRFCIIIAYTVYCFKPLSRDIISIFKFLYEKVERYHTKGTLWSGINTIWTIKVTAQVKQEKVCQLLIF